MSSIYTGLLMNIRPSLWHKHMHTNHIILFSRTQIKENKKTKMLISAFSGYEMETYNTCSRKVWLLTQTGIFLLSACLLWVNTWASTVMLTVVTEQFNKMEWMNNNELEFTAYCRQYRFFLLVTVTTETQNLLLPILWNLWWPKFHLLPSLQEWKIHSIHLEMFCLVLKLQEMQQEKQHIPSLIQKMQMVISMTNNHTVLYFSFDFNMHNALNVTFGLVQTKTRALIP